MQITDIIITPHHPHHLHLHHPLSCLSSRFLCVFPFSGLETLWSLVLANVTRSSICLSFSPGWDGRWHPRATVCRLSLSASAKLLSSRETRSDTPANSPSGLPYARRIRLPVEEDCHRALSWSTKLCCSSTFRYWWTISRRYWCMQYVLNSSSKYHYKSIGFSSKWLNNINPLQTCLNYDHSLARLRT